MFRPSRSAVWSRWMLVAPIAVSASLVAAPHAATPLPLPGPFVSTHHLPSVDVVAENQRCESCHSTIAEEWRRSLHKHAYDDPVFRSSVALEPQPFCRGCHAPEADPTITSQAALHALGVACVTCHVQQGKIIGTRTLPATATRHFVQGDPRLSTTDACAACHQFGFPLRPSAAMQNTLKEHAASRFADSSCQTCHMPQVIDASGRRHRSHDFHVVGNAALLRSAVRVQAFRNSPQALGVTLEAGDVGHSFPTGDMFRRLEVRAKIVDANGQTTSHAMPEVLEREFTVHFTEQGTDRIPVGDSRVSPQGTPRRVLVLFSKDTEGYAIHWEVAYQRMPPYLAKLFGIDTKQDEVIVAQGILNPVTKPPENE